MFYRAVIKHFFLYFFKIFPNLLSNFIQNLDFLLKIFTNFLQYLQVSKNFSIHFQNYLMFLKSSSNFFKGFGNQYTRIVQDFLKFHKFSQKFLCNNFVKIYLKCSQYFQPFLKISQNNFQQFFLTS